MLNRIQPLGCWEEPGVLGLGWSLTFGGGLWSLSRTWVLGLGRVTYQQSMCESPEVLPPVPPLPDGCSKEHLDEPPWGLGAKAWSSWVMGAWDIN